MLLKPTHPAPHLVLGFGWIKYVNHQEGKKNLAMTASWNLCCLPDVGRQGDTVHSTSITSLIPPLTGYHGNDCSSYVNQCVSNPCDPEGTFLCEELANAYRCVCQHGYTGPHCQTPLNHCVDGLCQHGSECEDLSGGFKCDCLPGMCTIQQGFISNGDNSSTESCT